MLNDILTELEGMSDAEKQALLNTEFPEEQTKEASAAIDQEQLANALYDYGWLVAERQVAEADGLDKIATEDLEAHDEALEETGAAVEEFLASTGLADVEDEVALQKEAQACAAFMFAGYSDFMDKLAAAKGKGAMKAIKGAMSSVKKHMSSAGKKVSKGAHKALALAKKHPGKAAAGAGAVAAGVYAGKKLHDGMKKKASEATVGELALAVAEIQAADQEVLSEIEDGIDKLAAAGKNKAVAFVKKHYAKLKGAAGEASAHVKKHKGLYGLGAGAAVGAGATHAAHKAGEK